MFHETPWFCRGCGHEEYIETGMMGGKCMVCGERLTEGSGESYDQEWIDEQKHSQDVREEYEDYNRRGQYR